MPALVTPELRRMISTVARVVGIVLALVLASGCQQTAQGSRNQTCTDSGESTLPDSLGSLDSAKNSKQDELQKGGSKSAPLHLLGKKIHDVLAELGEFQGSSKYKAINGTFRDVVHFENFAVEVDESNLIHVVWSKDMSWKLVQIASPESGK